MIDDSELDRLEALMQRATALPWSTMDALNEQWWGRGERRTSANGAGYIPQTTSYEKYERQFERIEDAVFVALARNLMPAILQELRFYRSSQRESAGTREYLRESDMVKMVIVVRTDLGMNSGKMCAQTAHAAMIFMLDLIGDGRRGTNPTDEQREWMFGNSDGRMAKIVVAIPSGEELLDIAEQAKKAGLLAHVVTDKTLKVPTCCAIGPHAAGVIDKITGALPLLRRSS